MYPRLTCGACSVHYQLDLPLTYAQRGATPNPCHRLQSWYSATGRVVVEINTAKDFKDKASMGMNL